MIIEIVNNNELVTAISVQHHKCSRACWLICGGGVWVVKKSDILG